MMTGEVSSKVWSYCESDLEARGVGIELIKFTLAGQCEEYKKKEPRNERQKGANRNYILVVDNG